MTLVDHLTELRRRIFICVAAVVVGSGIGFYFSGQIISFLRGPLPPNPDGTQRALNFLAPGEAFFIYIKISLVVGIILAMPVLLFQIWRFVVAGPDAGRAAHRAPVGPVALVFFLIGVTVAWIVLPFAMSFLIGFESKDFVYLPDRRGRTSGSSRRCSSLSGSRWSSRSSSCCSRRSASSRRSGFARRGASSILGIAIFAAVVTPGGDLVSPAVLGGVDVPAVRTVDPVRQVGRSLTGPSCDRAGRARERDGRPAAVADASAPTRPRRRTARASTSWS